MKTENARTDTAFVNRYFQNCEDHNTPIFAMNVYSDPRYYIKLRIKNIDILGLIDSGSTKTYLGKKAANFLGKFHDTNLRMRAANNNTIGIDWY